MPATHFTTPQASCRCGICDPQTASCLIYPLQIQACACMLMGRDQTHHMDAQAAPAAPAAMLNGSIAPRPKEAVHSNGNAAGAHHGPAAPRPLAGQPSALVRAACLDPSTGMVTSLIYDLSLGWGRPNALPFVPIRLDPDMWYSGQERRNRDELKARGSLPFLALPSHS